MEILFVGNIRGSGALIDELVAVLNGGGWLALPSECGYRLAFRSDRPPPAEIRNRLGPGWRREGFTRLLTDPKQANEYAHLGELENRLLDFFWPGPLVLLAVARQTNRQWRKIGLRCTNHPLTAEILKRCRFSVSSRALRDERGCVFYQPTALAQQLDGLEGRILRANAPCLNLTATVVEVLPGATRIVRPGFLSSRDLGLILPPPILLTQESAARRDDVSGQVNLVVVVGEWGRVARRLKTLQESYQEPPRILVSDETAEFLGDGRGFSLGKRGSPEYLVNLERVWSEISRSRAEVTVLVEGLADGSDLMERLTREARHVINTEDPGYLGRGDLTPRRNAGIP